MEKITSKRIYTTLLFLMTMVLYSQQTVTSFSPTSGLTGTTVTITGTNFNPLPSGNAVTFNNIPATVISATTTILTVEVPPTATTGSVKVKIGTVTATSSSVFTVLSNANCNGVSNNNSKYWYFGNQAAVAFESNGPVALTNSAMNQVEGVATMSDANGNLLFYTNGITIYNRNHQIMENGSGLLSHSSNTQAAFVVPFPGNPNQYFVITPGPYYYSIVDMTLDNGNGAIIPTAKNILINNESSEKVAGLLAANQTDIWLITYGSSQKRFNTYKITPSGITTTPVVSEFTTHSGHFGYMKISPDGTKIATANFDNNFHLYDFDAVTGTISNQRIISFAFGGHGSYGIEFSPNSNLVYVADHRGQHKIVQFDITLATPALIAASGTVLGANPHALGALQLGQDNKIYLAKENSRYLGVINQPNVVGEGCNYISEGVDLISKTSNLGLPGFVASAIINSEPYITSFTPTNGPTGTTVTINGINFNTTPGNNFVSINGIPATVVSSTATRLTVVVPQNATTGEISVAVGCGFVASTNDFTVTALGIADFNDAKIALFPNPSSGVFNISADVLSGASEVNLFDLNGRNVHQYKTENLKNEPLDLNHLQNGIYLLTIKNNNEIYTKKLIKQ